MVAEGGNLDTIFQSRMQNAGTGKAADISPINSDAYLFQMATLLLRRYHLKIISLFTIF
jgi:hypothetical protein